MEWVGRGFLWALGSFCFLLGIAESMGQELGDARWEVNMGESLGS